MIAKFGLASKSVFCAILLLTLIQCAANSPELPRDIMGVHIGMNKADAEARLNEIAAFERHDRREQQVWILRNDPRFSHIAVGFDKEDKIRYVTAIVTEKTATEKVPFSSVGDISKAKTEIVEPHYRYIWEVPEKDSNSAYYVNIYGDNPETLTMYSLVKKIQPESMTASPASNSQ